MKRLILIISIFFQIGANAQDANDTYFLKLVNAHRAKNGLGPVKYNKILDGASKLQSDYQLAVKKCTHYQEPQLVAASNWFYTAPNRINKVDSTWKDKFNQYEIGENVAKWIYAGPVYQPEMKLDTVIVKKLFDAWVASPGHNYSLLLPNATVAAFELSSTLSYSDNEVLKIRNYTFNLFATCLLAVELKK